MLRKYQALVEKHQRLVEALPREGAEASIVSRLATWCDQGPSSALALVSNGEWVATNARWNELEEAGRTWVKLGPEAKGSRRRDLRALALLEIDALGEREEMFQVAQLESPQRRQFIELRLERVSPRSEGLVLLVAHDLSPAARVRQAPAALPDRERDASERMRSFGQFASGVVHDLSSTLGALRLRVELLARSSGGQQSARDIQALKQIVTDLSSRVGGLREHLLDQAEPADPRQESVNLGQVIAEAVEWLRPELERDGARRISIEAELAELPRVPGTAAELRLMLLNLLLNARDAMPDKGRILLHASVEGDEVMLRVADEGAGIAEEHLPRLFEPFFTTKGQRGTGLGLAMARDVMERLGGAITAANRSEGGAVFTLTFPIAAKPRGGRAGGRPSPAKRLRVVEERP